MIFWMNSSKKKKEQRGCSHLSAEKSFSVVSLHFLRPGGSLGDSHRPPGWMLMSLHLRSSLANPWWGPQIPQRWPEGRAGFMGTCA